MNRPILVCLILKVGSIIKVIASEGKIWPRYMPPDYSPNANDGRLGWGHYSR